MVITNIANFPAIVKKFKFTLAFSFPFTRNRRKNARNFHDFPSIKGSNPTKFSKVENYVFRKECLFRKVSEYQPR
jgi:hypothetical protein